jgi:large subunit ribosomal protein L4
MPTIDVVDTSGSKVGTADLAEEIFGIEPNVAVMHQVVTAQLAARRAGTQSTKTRAEVRGGGAKPWKQKGTGRARQGSIRAPHWRGGGVALGPKPRSYAQRTPKKMVRLALRSALSDRLTSERIIVLDSWGLDVPKTKTARVALETLGTSGRVLAVVGRDDVNASKSLANLPNVHVCQPGELNTHDVLVSDWIVFTRDTVPGAPAATASRSEEGSA